MRHHGSRIVLFSYILILPIILFSKISNASSLWVSKANVDYLELSKLYAPYQVECPAHDIVRKAEGLNKDEVEWLEKRKPKTKQSFLNFLRYSTNLNESEYEFLLHENASNPNIGLSFSGGGFRAMLSGAGQLSALDNRTAGAFEKGLGGILDATTYIAGLSGGNWLVGTLSLNNWPEVEHIARRKNFWQLEIPLYEIGTASEYFTTSYIAWKQWISEITNKAAQGFKISFIDIWGRALSTRFLSDDPHNGIQTTWSDIRDQESFINADMPLPLSISVGKYKISDDTQYIAISDSTVYESTPFEFGSWDSLHRTLVDIKYLGSRLVNGAPQDNNSCFNGFDNAGFIMGSSSNIFDMGFGAFKDSFQKHTVIYQMFKSALSYISEKKIDDALFYPNPFYKTQNENFQDFAESSTLRVVDGGQDLENIPIVPLAIPERKVDTLFLFDNSADTTDMWPDGGSLSMTYKRQFTENGQNFAFPPVPSNDEIIESGLNKRPFFLGCDSKSLTNLTSIPPLIVYVPNSYYSFKSNFTTMRMVYTNDMKENIIKNGFEVASRGNLTLDNSYRDCVGCAIIRREQERLGIQQSDTCKKCFVDYCWAPSS